MLTNYDMEKVQGRTLLQARAEEIPKPQMLERASVPLVWNQLRR